MSNRSKIRKQRNQRSPETQGRVRGRRAQRFASASLPPGGVLYPKSLAGDVHAWGAVLPHWCGVGLFLILSMQEIARAHLPCRTVEIGPRRGVSFETKNMCEHRRQFFEPKWLRMMMIMMMMMMPCHARMYGGSVCVVLLRVANSP